MKGYEITVYGNGAEGMVALHAAALDARISRVVIENSLADYRSIVDLPLHRDVSDVVIPGVLRRYDTGDLMMAAWPHSIVIVNPRDALGNPMPEDEFRKREAYVFQSDLNLRTAMRISILSQRPLDLLSEGKHVAR